jgi:ABC-2 type transport system ATP-binding protein
MAVVEVEELRRTYGAFEALKGVSFRIEAGEIVGLLGPNGAGKSTTMKILTGYLAPTAGRAAVCGLDVLEDPIEVKRSIGYLPESAPIYGEMTVRAYLTFVGRVFHLGAAELARAIEKSAEECGITDRLGQRIGTLSRGYRQRVGIAQALLHAPLLLILDEPTNGLDPNQIIEIRGLIRKIGQTRTVILSTHILSEVQVTCDRVLIVHQGRLVADGPTAEVMGANAGQQVFVSLADGKVRVPEDQLVTQLCTIPGVARAQLANPGADRARFVLQCERDVREDVFRWAVAGGHVLVELSSQQSNLEEVFRRLTLDATRPAQ